jgi:hypothetical protein
MDNEENVDQLLGAHRTSPGARGGDRRGHPPDHCPDRTDGAEIVCKITSAVDVGTHPKVVVVR